jgi:ribonuclease HI
MLPPQQQQQQAGLQVTVFFDGGSRGNPGRAGYGYVIYDRDRGERVSHDGLCVLRV